MLGVTYHEFVSSHVLGVCLGPESRLTRQIGYQMQALCRLKRSPG